MKIYATRSLSAALLGLLLVTASCKKEADVTPHPEATPLPTDRTPAFVGKNLRMESFIMEQAVDLNGDGKADPDLMVFMRACDLDNTVRFEKNGHLSGDNGARHCDDDTDPHAGPASTWSYNESTQTLTIKDGQDPTDVSEWKVIDASAKALKVRVQVVEDGTPFGAVMSWKAI